MYATRSHVRIAIHTHVGARAVAVVPAPQKLKSSLIIDLESGHGCKHIHWPESKSEGRRLIVEIWHPMWHKIAEYVEKSVHVVVGNQHEKHTDISADLHIYFTADLPANWNIHRKQELEHGITHSHDRQRQHENGVERHEAKVQRESFSHVRSHARNRRILQVYAVFKPRKHAVKRIPAARTPHEAVSDSPSLSKVCIRMIRFRFGLFLGECGALAIILQVCVANGLWFVHVIQHQLVNRCWAALNLSREVILGRRHTSFPSTPPPAPKPLAYQPPCHRVVRSELTTVWAVSSRSENTLPHMSGCGARVHGSNSPRRMLLQLTNGNAREIMLAAPGRTGMGMIGLCVMDDMRCEANQVNFHAANVVGQFAVVLGAEGHETALPHCVARVKLVEHRQLLLHPTSHATLALTWQDQDEIERPKKNSWWNGTILTESRPGPCLAFCACVRWFCLWKYFDLSAWDARMEDRSIDGFTVTAKVCNSLHTCTRTESAVLQQPRHLAWPSISSKSFRATTACVHACMYGWASLHVHVGATKDRRLSPLVPAGYVLLPRGHITPIVVESCWTAAISVISIYVIAVTQNVFVRAENAG